MNPKNLVFNSDYPLDSILNYRSGQLVVPALNSTQQLIAHSLGYSPLIVGSWSHAADFSSSFENASFSGNYPNTTMLDVGADGTNLQVFAMNNTSSPRTFYWRVYTLAKHDAVLDIESTSSVAQNRLLINTDRNYTKLFKAGRVTSTTTINHGLGYRPQAMAWRTVGAGMTFPITSGFVYDTPAFGESSLEVTNQDLIIRIGENVTDVHYRIYLDDQTP